MDGDKGETGAQGKNVSGIPISLSLSLMIFASGLPSLSLFLCREIKVPKDTKVHLDPLGIRVYPDDLAHRVHWDLKDLRDPQDTTELMEDQERTDPRELKETKEGQDPKV